MQFDTYRSLYDLAKNDHLFRGKPADFYAHLLQHADNSQYQIITAIEAVWYAQHRPFYRLWPSLIPVFQRVSLNITLKNIQAQPRVFLIQLPAAQGSILVAQTKAHTLGVVVQTQNCVAANVIKDSTKPLAGQIEEHPVYTPMFHIAVAVLLLDDNPELIEPMILQADQHKPRTEALVRKAHRRGLYGWNIGQHVEVAPHIRLPHMGHRWTGPGRQILKLVPIKGCLVHKAAITTIPTENLDHDATV